MNKVSVIVPCYNEEKVLPLFYAEMCKVMKKMDGVPFEIIFVNDGSVDSTEKILTELAEKDDRIFYISFSKNFGKESAIYAGIKNITGDYTVIMDADLQDPPSLLPQMYEILENGEYDSVATGRSTRKNEPPIRSMFAHVFYKLFNRLCHLDVVDGARDYRMMTRKMADTIANLPERNRFSKGIYSWVGFKTHWILYENVERAAGETKWSFIKLMKYALEGFTAYSDFLLKTPVFLGIISLFASAVCLIYGIAAKAEAVLFSSLILFVSGVILFFIGILGEYISKILAESKGRPQYIVKKTNIIKKTRCTSNDKHQKNIHFRSR